jgi:hypothetical protein
MRLLSVYASDRTELARVQDANPYPLRSSGSATR